MSEMFRKCLVGALAGAARKRSMTPRRLASLIHAVVIAALLALGFAMTVAGWLD